MKLFGRIGNDFLFFKACEHTGFKYSVNLIPHCKFSNITIRYLSLYLLVKFIADQVYECIAISYFSKSSYMSLKEYKGILVSDIVKEKDALGPVQVRNLWSESQVFGPGEILLILHHFLVRLSVSHQNLMHLSWLVERLNIQDGIKSHERGFANYFITNQRKMVPIVTWIYSSN